MATELDKVDLEKDPAAWIEGLIRRFLEISPENSLKNKTGEKAWENVLIGYSSGADPLYESYKDHVGEFHFTPAEIYSLTFPVFPANPGELTVVSWVLPVNPASKEDNRMEEYYPSERWVRARVFGEEFNVALKRHLLSELEAKGVQAVAPPLTPYWKPQVSPKYGRSSVWSERHAAYAAGLGTFGLCDGLITAAGKAHRLGSVVARLSIPPTPRPYENHHAYCLFYQDGSCTSCIRRCPVGAITEQGHDKVKCREHVYTTCTSYTEEKIGIKGFSCGLCQTGVPCESGIPVK